MKYLSALMLLWLTLLAGPAFAQTGAGALRGTMTTAANQPVPFATVAVLNSALGATADQGGQFSIANVPAGRQTVVVSSVGYATRTQLVEVAAGQTAPLTLTLTPSTAGLDEVVVTAQKDETTLQRTPMAVSALGTKQLCENRVWDFKDLTALAPNLFVVEHANSTGGTGRPSSRRPTPLLPPPTGPSRPRLFSATRAAKTCWPTPVTPAASGPGA